MKFFNIIFIISFFSSFEIEAALSSQELLSIDCAISPIAQECQKIGDSTPKDDLKNIESIEKPTLIYEESKSKPLWRGQSLGVYFLQDTGSTLSSSWGIGAESRVALSNRESLYLALEFRKSKSYYQALKDIHRSYEEIYGNGRDIDATDWQFGLGYRYAWLQYDQSLFYLGAGGDYRKISLEYKQNFQGFGLSQQNYFGEFSERSSLQLRLGLGFEYYPKPWGHFFIALNYTGVFSKNLNHKHSFNNTPDQNSLENLAKKIESEVLWSFQLGFRLQI